MVRTAFWQVEAYLTGVIQDVWHKQTNACLCSGTQFARGQVVPKELTFALRDVDQNRCRASTRGNHIPMTVSSDPSLSLLKRR
jgi:hypothetical protein